MQSNDSRSEPSAVYKIQDPGGDDIELVLKTGNESSDCDDGDESVQESQDLKCEKCNRRYKNVRRLQAHMETCETKDATCEELTLEQICKMEMDADSLAKQNICFCCEESHETAHSGHIRCQDCPKSFKNVGSYRRHVSFLHSSIANSHPCHICNAKCATEVILHHHLVAHETGKKFACVKCGKEFTRKYHLVRHQKFSKCDPSIAKKTTPCNVCGKEFYRIDNLRTHLRQHIGENKPTTDYQCPYCQRYFQGTTTLNIHIRTHTGEKPYICDVCQRGFPSLGAVRKHRRSHTGEKPFECKECKRTFAAKEVLNRHMKTHTGERPHVCDICSKGFIQSVQLKAHMFLHGRGGFPCEKCNVNCDRKMNVSNHMQTYHSAKKKIFDCLPCEMIFEKKEELVKHMEIHRGDLFIKCRACLKRFIDLDKHIRCPECTICDGLGDKAEQIPHDHKEKCRRPPGRPPKPKVIPIPISPVQEIESSDEEKPRKLKVLTSKPKEKKQSEKSNQPVEPGDLTLVAYDPEKDHAEYRLEIGTEPPTENTVQKCDAIPECNWLTDDQLTDRVTQLLNLLLDAELLSSFGWPNASVEHVLSAVIQQCDHKPADYDTCPDYGTKMRENAKLLITVVVDNDSTKNLLNNHTIDEVIMQIIDMTHK